MESNHSLRVSMVQSPIAWEDRAENLAYYGKLLHGLIGKTDLAVLPELFTTGLSMRVHDLSEPVDGKTIASVKQWAKEYGFAVTGSFIASEEGRFYNRAFFITPDGREYYYDKRHLFRMAGEDRSFSAGDKRLIIDYLGWKICPMVCYDLRFPVWSRNVDNAYDVLIYVANWVSVRRDVWKTLLHARAIENMAYVCGVNRVGVDGRDFAYHGSSRIYTPKGEKLADAGEEEETIVTCALEREPLDTLREKFPVWRDADQFDIR
ncbi:amidohydrolase [Tannerella sp.]|uniref:amidohydrolase n=1 Tax=Tannerella sp. TaxID=2382127 RepID=UPI0026DD8859|nr:amidohydrolase [Tannerella sp.]MDO4703294.1 amidohydrolase [Tannerella sp.]